LPLHIVPGGQQRGPLPQIESHKVAVGSTTSRPPTQASPSGMQPVPHGCWPVGHAGTRDVVHADSKSVSNPGGQQPGPAA
jgi:hypothetical protein